MPAMQKMRPAASEQSPDPPRIQSEKRDEQRIISHAPLIFTPFSSKFHREYASMTFNHSQGGMCLESAEPFRNGSVLYIRIVNSTFDELYHENRQHLRTSTLAEVVWCREQQDKFGTYYRIGVRYF